jgi:tetratricopeptide (TPR) repeat protein
MPPVHIWHLRVVLLLLTVAAYLPLWSNNFVRLDDEQYITQNPNVTDGLSARGFAWAWGNVDARYWQPVSWLSLQFDAELFSTETATGEQVLTPAAFHGHSLFWHAATALLLFALWHRLTGARWRSFLVAALFAVHPMHVESVAWAAERKDVLSVFFGLLAVWAYIRYAAAPSWPRYLGLTAAFVVSLLSKPMLVTLPFVLLLLDYWPLQRVVGGRWAVTGERGSLPLSAVRRPPTTLLLEKLPLFALAAVVAVITCVARERTGATVSLADLPLSARLANAATAYGWYLSHTVWPSRLAVLYPHPYRAWPVLPAAAGAAALGAVTLLSLWQARRRPWLVTGWLWFAGALVPVIGLAQGGEQAWADRFSYWPHVGLFAAAVWGLGELARRARVPAAVIGAAAALALGALAVTTWTQVGYWRDSVTLWERTLAVTDDNAPAHAHFGADWLSAGRPDAAQRQFAEAVRIRPEAPELHYFLGVSMLSLGKDEEAAGEFREAARLDPAYADAWHNLGVACLRQGLPERAARALGRALELRPDAADSLAALGQALWRAGRREEALRTMQAALHSDPDCADAWYGLGVAHLTRGELWEATAALRTVVRVRPQYPNAHSQLGLALGRQGWWNEAVACQITAVKLQEQGDALFESLGGRAPAPDSVRQSVTFQCRLAFALDHQGDHAAAAEVYRRALERDPAWPEKFSARARLLAADPAEGRRDPRLAHEMASQAAQAPGGPSAFALDALAAAEAAVIGSE